MMAAHKIFIRTLKEDSVFIYNTFEALEGWCAYSTLPFDKQDPHRDHVLIVPEAFQSAVMDLLQSLSHKVTILPNVPSKS